MSSISFGRVHSDMELISTKMLADGLEAEVLSTAYPAHFAVQPLPPNQLGHRPRRALPHHHNHHHRRFILNILFKTP